MEIENIRDTPIIKIFKGYDIEEIMSLDEDLYDLNKETPIYKEEVKIEVER